MPIFEYKILVQKAGMIGAHWDEIQDIPADKVLAAAGAQGWELIAVTPIAGHYGVTGQVQYHFKRAVN